jgi:DNA-binding NtrC family response regulator
LPERRSEAVTPLTTTVIPEPVEVPANVNHSLLDGISLDQPLRDARDEFERIYFEYHLGRENHSMTRVSEKTGLERTHLYRKLKQLGIDSSRKKSTAS